MWRFHEILSEVNSNLRQDHFPVKAQEQEQVQKQEKEQEQEKNIEQEQEQNYMVNDWKMMVHYTNTILYIMLNLKFYTMQCQVVALYGNAMIILGTHYQNIHLICIHRQYLSL